MSDDDPGFEKPFPEAPEPAAPAPLTSPAAPAAPAAPATAAVPGIPPAAPSPSVPPPPTAASSPASGFGPPAPFLPDPTPRVGYAGFWIRVLACLIDAVVLWIVNVGTHTVIRLSAGVPVLPLWSTTSGRSMSLSCAESLVEIVVDWLYFALLESSVWQGTLGKQALRLRVTDFRGQRISFGRATGRFFAKFVSAVTLGIGFVMVAFTSRRQGLHDMMVETVVLRDYGTRTIGITVPGSR